MRREIQHGALVLACGLTLAQPAGAAAAELPLIGLGFEATVPPKAGALTVAPLPLPPEGLKPPLLVRIEAHWADFEKSRGRYDWGPLDHAVDRLRDGGHEPVLNFWGGNPLYSDDIIGPPGPRDPGTMEAWETFLRSAGRHFKGRVKLYELGRALNGREIWGGADPVAAASFFIKKSAVQIRTADRGARVVLGGMFGPDEGWISGFLAEGTAPYFDVISFRPDSATPFGAQCRRVLEAVRAAGSGATIWAEAVPARGDGEARGREILAQLMTAFDEGVSAVFFALPLSAGGTPAGGEFLVRARAALPPGAGRVPSADRVAFVDSAGTALGSVRAVSFHQPTEGISVTAFWTEGEDALSEAEMRITARRPGPPTLFEPVTGVQSVPPFEAVPGGAAGRVPVGPSPRFLLYREGVGPQIEAEGTESLEVSAARGITADEVIARYREFQADQDERLAHFRADIMITYHFRLGGSARSIDIGMAGEYFFDPRVGAEWELRDFYVNGNRSRWKEFPEIPFIQPEKVLTLPLDITFDRTYRYAYEGEASAEGRDCHVLSFEPADPLKSLYRGRVWIDKETWARVRVDAIQTRLDPPFQASEETTIYAPVLSPDGRPLWVQSRIEGQQAFSTAGRSLVVLREFAFSNHKLNDPDFSARRDEAYASKSQMLRDTDKGLRYLLRDEEGRRTVKEEFDSAQLFALGGVIYDPSLNHPVPLAGINYFDYDFRKKGIQTNLFFAGALMSLNVTKPNLAGSGFDVGGDLFLSALTRTDRSFREGEEVDERDIERREQSIQFNLSRELGTYVHLRSSLELAYQAFDEGDDTDPEFVVPADTLAMTALLSSSFNRAGYELRAAASYSARGTFEPWGNPCVKAPGSRPGAPLFYGESPPFFCTPEASAAEISNAAARERAERRMRERKERLAGDDYDPGAAGFFRYEVGAWKEFFLPSFQKIRASLDLYGGQDLDRFSRYAFDRFGTHVRGFSGSGVRFDRGVIAGAAYMFNLADLIRLEGSVQQAWVEERGNGSGRTSHTGLGISTSVLGPWKTIWQLEYGYALRSDIGAVKGDQEIFLVILKLF